MVPKDVCVKRTLKRSHLIYSSDPTDCTSTLKIMPVSLDKAISFLIS